MVILPKSHGFVFVIKNHIFGRIYLVQISWCKMHYGVSLLYFDYGNKRVAKACWEGDRQEVLQKGWQALRFHQMFLKIEMALSALNVNLEA